MCVLTRNDFEPDIAYFGESKVRSIHSETDKFPVPDFVVEVLSDCSAARDRGVKFDDYAAHGVSEYWIIDPAKELLEQYVLDSSGNYQLKFSGADGEVASAVVEGFRIPVRAIFDAAVNQETRAKLESSP